jgi:hypothetical protein
MSQASKVISTAKAEVGYTEGKTAGRWNNKQKYSPAVPGLEWSNYQPWCATFCSWVAMKAGVASLFPRTASCATGVAWFKKAGRFSEYPAIGAQIFFGSGGGTHTGIVYAYDKTYVYTVEGNTNTSGSPEGNGVHKRKRRRADAYVYGYGLPKYTEGITTADPSKKSKRGYTYKATASNPATGTSTPAGPPPFPGRDKFRPGANNPYVTQLGQALVRTGYGRYYQAGPGPRWSDADRNAVRAFQHAQGWAGSDADGYPGPETWRRLFK